MATVAILEVANVAQAPAHYGYHLPNRFKEN
jgi:hypothetical protein